MTFSLRAPRLVALLFWASLPVMIGCAGGAGAPTPAAAPTNAAAAGSTAPPLAGPSDATSIRRSAHAPVDHPLSLRSRRQLDTLLATVAPYVAQARASYPEARRRFLAGLPPGQHFSVTTHLDDDEGHFEVVFIAVHSIVDGEVRGYIQNDINVVKGYRSGQRVRFPEGELLDWTITRPDGSEEGNVVGKFMDTYHPPP